MTQPTAAPAFQFRSQVYLEVLQHLSFGSNSAQVTWVAMIICILFFEMSLANALWTGLIVGLAYTLFVRAMYRHQLAVVSLPESLSSPPIPECPVLELTQAVFGTRDGSGTDWRNGLQMLREQQQRSAGDTPTQHTHVVHVV